MIHQIVCLATTSETKLLIDHATTDKDNTTQDTNRRYILFYIRKDCNLMWSIVTDIGNKCKQAGSNVPVFTKSSSTCFQHSTYIEGGYRTLQNSLFILTLLCQDHPKMGDSMTCHNFVHRIAQKWAILWSLLETCRFWHANHHGWAGLFS